LLAIARGLGRLLDLVDGLVKWLVLPLLVLLFLQWPLRDLVQAYSREANDLGQCLFALYVAASVTAATRARAHLAVDAFARRLSGKTRNALAVTCSLAVIIPWAGFVLISSRSLLIGSVLQLERFPDTANPGYFIVKLALGLLAALMLTGALRELAAALGGDTHR